MFWIRTVVSTDMTKKFVRRAHSVTHSYGKCKPIVGVNLSQVSVFFVSLHPKREKFKINTEAHPSTQPVHPT